MFVRKKKNNSGSTSIQIIQKQKGKYNVVETLGSSFDEKEIEKTYRQAQEAIPKRFNQLTLFQESITPLNLSELNGKIGVVFYDMTTIYFESSQPDELRVPGFSKDEKHQNPQIFLCRINRNDLNSQY